jgi:hypothetical protein
MSVNPKLKFWGGLFLVGIGLLIALVEVAVHIYGKFTGHRYDIGHVDLLIALVIGFVGMYILSPKGAKDGGQFLVNNTIRVIQVIRSGRRKTDVVNAVVEDIEGNTATIQVPPLTSETEVPIQGTSEIPKRRAADHAATGEHKKPDSGERNA